MSLETVRNKCIELNPGIDKIKLDKNLLASMKRFEKVVRAESHNYLPSNIFRIISKENETPWQAEKRYFEEHKLEFIHLYLKMLIDLYDYELSESLKKSS